MFTVWEVASCPPRSFTSNGSHHRLLGERTRLRKGSDVEAGREHEDIHPTVEDHKGTFPCSSAATEFTNFCIIKIIIIP